jgi:membrane protein DedA with SNARE-associated domain
MENFLIHAGYGALVLFAFVEACCVPISSEVTFGFAGVLAYQGHLNLALVILLGTLAELAGSYVAYAVGRVAERPVIERLGRY